MADAHLVRSPDFLDMPIFIFHEVKTAIIAKIEHPTRERYALLTEDVILHMAIQIVFFFLGEILARLIFNRIR